MIARHFPRPNFLHFSSCADRHSWSPPYPCPIGKHSAVANTDGQDMQRHYTPRVYALKTRGENVLFRLTGVRLCVCTRVGSLDLLTGKMLYLGVQRPSSNARANAGTAEPIEALRDALPGVCNLNHVLCHLSLLLKIRVLAQDHKALQTTAQIEVLLVFKLRSFAIRQKHRGALRLPASDCLRSTSLADDVNSLAHSDVDRKGL